MDYLEGGKRQGYRFGSRAPDGEKLRPSEVFAQRLQETRKARGLTQKQLAEMLTEAGIPMSKTALLGIETGKRGLSLDEALGIAAVLNAVPAHMLTPHEGEMVKVNDHLAIGGLGFREFLRYGFPWSLDAVPYEALPEAEREKFQLNLARLALGLNDAYRGADKAGIKDAVDAIVDEVTRHQIERVRDEVGRHDRPLTGSPPSESSESR
jgi:transcriptional regulator with XRE-family HTH domain